MIIGRAKDKAGKMSLKKIGALAITNADKRIQANYKRP